MTPFAACLKHLKMNLILKLKKIKQIYWLFMLKSHKSFGHFCTLELNYWNMQYYAMTIQKLVAII